jgi:uncharacterized membrane protein
MKKTFHKPHFMLALALVGLGVAYYDAYALYNGQALWCPPPIDGCNEVASSPYARIFNLPVGYYGVVYYLYMFGLAALLAFDPLSSGLRLAALIYSAIGVGFSIYFSYLQFTLSTPFASTVSSLQSQRCFCSSRQFRILGRHARWNSYVVRLWMQTSRVTISQFYNSKNCL